MGNTYRHIFQFSCGTNLSSENLQYTSSLIFKLITIYSSQELVLFTLTATLDSLRPSSCENGSRLCETPSKFQFAVLYASITLASIELGGTRFTIGTMGANQFDKPKNQGFSLTGFSLPCIQRLL